MLSVLFLDLANGGWCQSYRNEEHGVTLVVGKETRDADQVTVWTADQLPGQEFVTYDALCSAVRDG